MKKWLNSLIGYIKSSSREKKLLKEFRENLKEGQKVSFVINEYTNQERHLTGVIAKINDGDVDILLGNSQGRVLCYRVIVDGIFPENYFNKE